MTKILIIGGGPTCSWNKGAAAIVISASKALKKVIPDAEFTLISPPGHFEFDSKRCPPYGIKPINSFNGNVYLWPIKIVFCVFCCFSWRVLCKHLHLKINAFLYNRMLREYSKADVIVDLSGEGISDNFGFFWNTSTSAWILMGYMLGKPIVIYAHSMGPFKKRFNLFLARFTYNKVRLLITREELTQKHLQTVGGINKHIYLTADSAFSLKPASDKRVTEILLNEGYSKNTVNPLIGISLSEATRNVLKISYKEYVEKIVGVVDYLTEKLDAIVIFVPHVIYPQEELKDSVKIKKEDDRDAAEEIYQMVKYKSKIVLISNEYTPEELKGVVGQCDMFIGARMHANIAALSMGVPTVGIAYSSKFHKYYGIFKMMGQEKYVCNVKNMTLEELISKINNIWLNKEEIKRELISKSKTAEKVALYTAKLVKDTIDPRINDI